MPESATVAEIREEGLSELAPNTMGNPIPERDGVIACGERMSGVLLGNDHRNEQVAPVSVASVMAGRADQFDRNTGFDGLHHSLVEAMKIIGDDADRGLLFVAHG